MSHVRREMSAAATATLPPATKAQANQADPQESLLWNLHRCFPLHRTLSGTQALNSLLERKQCLPQHHSDLTQV